MAPLSISSFSFRTQGVYRRLWHIVNSTLLSSHAVTISLQSVSVVYNIKLVLVSRQKMWTCPSVSLFITEQRVMDGIKKDLWFCLHVHECITLVKNTICSKESLFFFVKYTTNIYHDEMMYLLVLGLKVKS